MNRIRSLVMAAAAVYVGSWACKADAPANIIIPTITSVVPTSGTTAGGTVVIVKGTNFASAPAIDSVRFGNAKAPQFSVVGDSATVTTPPHAAGTVPVTLWLRSRDTVSKADAFTFVAPVVVPPPVINSVTPSIGSTAGGTAIVIAGTGFQTGAGVTVGGANATGLSVTATSINATTPAGTAGAKDLVVTNPDAKADTATFTYVVPVVPPPVINSVTPSSGSTAGGTAIVIAGTAFQTGAAVTVGGASATGVSVTATLINASTPPGTAGTKDLVVTNPDAKADTAVFTYVAPSTGTPIFQDGFETGDLTHTENGIAWGTGVAVSTDIAHAGTRSLKFAVTGSTYQQNFGFANSYPEIWLEWYQYFPNGTEGLGAKYLFRDGPSSDNNKFLRLWAVSYDPPNRFKVGFSTLPVGATGDGSLYTEYGQSGGLMGGYGSAQWNPAITDAYRGRWVQFRVHVKVASAANNDGVVQLWADGVLKINNTTLAMYPTGGINNFIKNGYLMGSQNSGFDATTYTYMDDFKIYSGNPGW